MPDDDDDDDDIQSIASTAVAPTVLLMGPQAGKYKLKPEEIHPNYNPDKSYAVADVRAMIQKLRSENKGMQDVKIKASKQQFVLFQVMPHSVDALNERLHKAIPEIIKWKQEQAAKVPLPLAGEGLRHAATFDWVPFGKWVIARNQLVDKDWFLLGRPKGHGKMAAHPPRTVSASLKIALLAAIAGNPIPYEILTLEEKVWFDWVLDDAELMCKKKVPEPLQIYRTPKQIRIRLRDLMAEIAKGPNDNPALKVEFKDLFRLMCVRGGFKMDELIRCEDFIATF